MAAILSSIDLSDSFGEKRGRLSYLVRNKRLIDVIRHSFFLFTSSNHQIDLCTVRSAVRSCHHEDAMVASNIHSSKVPSLRPAPPAFEASLFHVTHFRPFVRGAAFCTSCSRALRLSLPGKARQTQRQPLTPSPSPTDAPSPTTRIIKTFPLTVPR